MKKTTQYIKKVKQQIFLYVPCKVYPTITDCKDLIEAELTNLITPLIKISPVKINLKEGANDFSVSFVVKDTMSENLFFEIYNCLSVYFKTETGISMYYKVGDDIILKKLKSPKVIQSINQEKSVNKISFILDE